MSGPKSFVDIHCHLLPGVDDGAASWEESLAMAQLAVADGISTVVVTPHQLGSYACNGGDMIRAGCRQLQDLLDRHGVPLGVLPGADVRIEPDLTAKIRAGDALTLADRRRHVLLELPHELYLPLDRLLGELQRAGLVGILSHPERNLGLLGRPRLAESLVDAGCLMQVTASSLVGTFGPEVRDFAEWLVDRGLVHFVATDAHGSKSRRPLLRRTFERLVELARRQAALELCCDNPARVVAGEDVAPGRRSFKGPRLAGWFRRRKAG